MPLAARLGLTTQACAAGILEISAWNQANALRRITTKRGLDVRDFPMVTFGGSGSLLACRLMDILDIRAVLVPPNPGNVSAYGLLTVDVRNDYVRTAVAADRGLDLDALAAVYDELTDQAREALLREGFARRRAAHRAIRRPAVPGAGLRGAGGLPGRAAIDRAWADAVVEAFHDAHRALYGYDFRGKADQRVEWVNLRVTGIGPIPRPEIPEIGSRHRRSARPHWPARQVYFGDWLDAQIIDRAQLLARVTRSAGPPSCRSSVRRSRSIPDSRPTVDRFGNLLITKERASDRSIRSWWRSSPAPWLPSRPRWRRRSAGPPARR